MAFPRPPFVGGREGMAILAILRESSRISRVFAIFRRGHLGHLAGICKEFGSFSWRCLPRDTGLLEAVLSDMRARLLVIDPLVAFLDARLNINNDASVRRALYRLAWLAEKHQCAMVLIRHLNKRAGLPSLYRGGGSIGLSAASRSAWLAARDPEEPERRVLAHVKNNLGPAQPSLAFTVTVPAGGGHPLISWLGPCAWTADQLVGSKAGPISARDWAVEFLQALLREGPHTSRDIWTLAQKEGLSKRTLARAKQRLRIRSERVWAEGRRLSYWLLPRQELPEGVKPQVNEPNSVDRWLEQLRTQYPSATPIDDL
jgi:AAA domain